MCLQEAPSGRLLPMLFRLQSKLRISGFILAVAPLEFVYKVAGHEMKGEKKKKTLMVKEL